MPTIVRERKLSARPVIVIIMTTTMNNPTRQPILKGPADADHYRVKVGRFWERWYTDPLPADDIAQASGEDVWPSVSTVKNADSTDWTFVGLKRVAEALERDPKALDGLDYETRYSRLKEMNKLGLSRAADRGTQVHTYMENGLRGKALTDDERFDDEEGRKYLPAVQAFFDAYQPEMVAAELVCINRTLNGYGYGGTADALIRIDGKTYLPDWKSRDQDSSHGAYPAEAAQLGAYAAADYILVDGDNGPERMRLPHLDGGLIVSIKPDGVRVYPIDLDLAQQQWQRLHAWWVARRTERDPIRNPWPPRKVKVSPKAAAVPTPRPEPLTPTGIGPLPDLDNLIAQADSVQRLYDLWVNHQTSWTPAHTELAAARKALLAAGVAS